MAGNFLFESNKKKCLNMSKLLKEWFETNQIEVMK